MSSSSSPDFAWLEPLIRDILSAPGTDLATISAKRVRRRLSEIDSSLTPDYLKTHKDAVDDIIASVFAAVSEEHGGTGSGADEVKRKREPDDDDEGGLLHGGESEVKKPKKSKLAADERADAELARKLSSEINGRARRTTARGGSGTPKRGKGARKSAAVVDSDDDSAGEGPTMRKKKAKKTANGEGGTKGKGGFGKKEYLLSDSLAALLEVPQLSRPQVVKNLWVYIKANELQNPSNKKEILCDARMRSVFGTERIDMFKMNKVLGQHLHEPGE